MNENPRPMVSVWMITYNHEKYISEAVDGILMQKTNFQFELVIGEDCSTDKTAEIIKAYQEKHPEIIKVRFNNSNIGMMPNVIKTLEECRGKYIALCEGDDYWTDPFKLQKQVDFLEEKNEYSGCAHQCEIYFENKKEMRPFFRKNVPSIIEMDDLLGSRLFHTASLIARGDIFRKNRLPNFVPSGDKAIFLLVGAYGKIRFFEETMACYRMHDGGVLRQVTADTMEKDLTVIPWIKSIYPSFNSHKYYTFVYHTILNFSTKISKKQVLKHSFWYLYHMFYKFPRNIKPSLSYIKNEFPSYWRKTRK